MHVFWASASACMLTRWVIEFCQVGVGGFFACDFWLLSNRSGMAVQSESCFVFFLSLFRKMIYQHTHVPSFTV